MVAKIGRDGDFVVFGWGNGVEFLQPCSPDWATIGGEFEFHSRLGQGTVISGRVAYSPTVWVVPVI